MGHVPHSGNNCSGLCRTPCDHADCWQCVEVHDEAVPRELLKKAKADMALTEKGKGLLSGLPAQRPEDYAKTTITHAALKALCERAGIRMDWNNGDPIFHDDGTIAQVEKAERDATKRALKDKVKELEDIVAKQKAGEVEARVAASLAKAANQQMDDMVNDIMRKSVTDTLKADAEANEARVVEELKSKGASDDDIEAAKALLGWHPGADVTEMPFTQSLVASWDEAGIIRPDQLQSYLTMLDAQLVSVSGLNDLLTGPAPQRVSDQTIDISKTIGQWKARFGAKVLGDGPTFIVHPDMVKDLL